MINDVDLRKLSIVPRNFPTKETVLQKLQTRYSAADRAGWEVSFAHYKERREPNIISIGNIFGEIERCYVAESHWCTAKSIESGVVSIQDLVSFLHVGVLYAHLYYFWHVSFRKIFPDHRHPLQRIFLGHYSDCAGVSLYCNKLPIALEMVRLAQVAKEKDFVCPAEEPNLISMFILNLVAGYVGIKVDLPMSALEDAVLYDYVLQNWQDLPEHELVPLLELMATRHAQQCSTSSKVKEVKNIAYFYFPLEVLSVMRLRQCIGKPVTSYAKARMFSPFDVLPDSPFPEANEPLLEAVMARVRADWPDYDAIIASALA